MVSKPVKFRKLDLIQFRKTYFAYRNTKGYQVLLHVVDHHLPHDLIANPVAPEIQIKINIIHKTRNLIPRYNLQIFKKFEEDKLVFVLSWPKSESPDRSLYIVGPLALQAQGVSGERVLECPGGTNECKRYSPPTSSVDDSPETPRRSTERTVSSSPASLLGTERQLALRL